MNINVFDDDWKNDYVKPRRSTEQLAKQKAKQKARKKQIKRIKKAKPGMTNKEAAILMLKIKRSKNLPE